MFLNNDVLEFMVPLKKLFIMRYFSLLLCFVLFLNCKTEPKTTKEVTNIVTIDTLQGTSLLGKPLLRRQVDIQKDSLHLVNYNEAHEKYLSDSTNADHIIWVGRRIAYLGDYQKAIKYYSKGISLYPKEARFYRHRGHRYISTRQFDKAIADFNQAVLLIEGTENQIEPDGIPNKFNTPVSTLHGNIYYHLGLAHYLKNELPNALMAFEKCLATLTNNDNQVSSKHWLYMIHRRLGNNEKAAALLEPITKDMEIIENVAYHQLLLFYKGELSEDELTGSGSTGSSEAVQYGIANWHHYHGDIEKAKFMYNVLVATGNWAGFGYIAAEADLSRLQSP